MFHGSMALSFASYNEIFPFVCSGDNFEQLWWGGSSDPFCVKVLEFRTNVMWGPNIGSYCIWDHG